MQFFFKRGALWGYQKGFDPRLKKVKHVTFKAHWRLNLGLTPEQSGSKKAECLFDDPIGRNAKIFQKGGFKGAFFIKKVSLSAEQHLFDKKPPPKKAPFFKKKNAF